MISRAPSVYISQHPLLFPAPLQIKKTRRSTFRRLAQRKATHSRLCVADPHGPLDDIIDEITAGIWPALPDESDLEFFSKSLTPFEDAFSWSVTPLPVSRIPSDHPLTIRKTRNSRSTASGSSTSDAVRVSISTDTSEQGELLEAEFLPSMSQYYISHFISGAAMQEPTKPRLAMNQDPATRTIKADQSVSTTENQLATVLEKGDGSSQEVTSQPLRKRFFSLSKPMGKLRLRTNTGDLDKKNSVLKTGFTNGKRSPSQTSSPTLGSPTDQQVEGTSKPLDHEIGMDDAVAAFLARNGRSASVMNTFHSQVAPSFPSPLEHRDEAHTIFNNGVQGASILSTAVRILPEVKVLESEHQTFWITVEVEGVLHNRHPLQDPCLDVVLVIDNAYYVTKDCFHQSINLAMSMLHDLRKGDRVALYTTHCTHETVTGTVPDLLYPLKSVDSACLGVVREILEDVRTLGTQTWDRPRPNSSLNEVIKAVARSITSKGPKHDRTHFVILSPTVKEIHKVSKHHPELQIHQVNTAILPIYTEQEPEAKICNESCCDNVTISNWACYESPPDRLRQILRNARSGKPLDMIYNLHVDLRRRPGCEVVKYRGSPEVPYLRLGQVHTFFAEVSINSASTMEMDLESHDPVRDSSLITNNMRQDLLNAKAMGALKVHLLSVQVMHQSTLLSTAQWTFTEAPLLVYKEMGRLSWPTDRALEVYKRRFFFEISRSTPIAAIEELDKLSAIVKPEMRDSIQGLVGQMSKEILNHQAIIEYELSDRQKLPNCVGPIYIPPAHDFVVRKWGHHHKRKGMIVN